MLIKMKNKIKINLHYSHYLIVLKQAPLNLFEVHNNFVLDEDVPLVDPHVEILKALALTRK